MEDALPDAADARAREEARREGRRAINRRAAQRLYDKRRCEISCQQLLKALARRGHRPTLSSVQKYELFWNVEKEAWDVPPHVWERLRAEDAGRQPGETRPQRPEAPGPEAP